MNDGNQSETKNKRYAIPQLYSQMIPMTTAMSTANALPPSGSRSAFLPAPELLLPVPWMKPLPPLLEPDELDELEPVSPRAPTPDTPGMLSGVEELDALCGFVPGFSPVPANDPKMVKSLLTLMLWLVAATLV
jgi:hypothetical protein